MVDLVASSDPDVADFDPAIGDFFLRAAGEVVRDYCGWHIAPPQTDTLTLDIGQHRLVMLPSRNVSAVASVTIDGQVLVEGTDYTWDRRGWVELCRHWCHGISTADLVFTHGYDACPLPVKSVVLELASTATTLPAGNASQVSSPGYRILFEPNSLGTTLLPNQLNRLAKYKLGGFA